MKGDERCDALMSATMDTVAECGLSNFAMKKVTDRVGCSEMLIYKYFTTKEKLFYSCYSHVHAEIGKLFGHMGAAMQLQPESELGSTVRLCWTMYFDYLVKHRNETLFYFAYRESSYIREHEGDDEVYYIAEFAEFFDAIDKRLGIYRLVGRDHLLTYVLDTTGLFAKRVIRGELPETPRGTEMIWRLIASGVIGLMHAEK